MKNSFICILYAETANFNTTITIYNNNYNNDNNNDNNKYLKS